MTGALFRNKFVHRFLESCQFINVYIYDAIALPKTLIAWTRTLAHSLPGFPRLPHQLLKMNQLNGLERMAIHVMHATLISYELTVLLFSVAVSIAICAVAE